MEKQSSIRFSVEESIWFQKGQEVAELLSMSLDPEIIIQEHDQYISVRGGLILTGEYHAQQSDDEVRAINVQPPGVRVVQEVVTREDGVSQLKHKFPVDITIPKNRIQNLNDVYVMIETFDYELPQRGNLVLEAELSITGIYGDQEREQQPIESVQDETDENLTEEALEIQPSSSNVEELEQPSYKEEKELEQLSYKEEEELVQPLMRGNIYENEVADEDEQDDNPFIPFIVEAKRDTSISNDVLDVDQEEDQEQEENVPVFTRQSPQLEFKSRIDEPEMNQEMTDKEEKGYGTRDENTLSLTKIFTKEEEAETTKVKICIVQKDETIELIAERYDVQPQALIRVNNLDREHLAEGQVLYIPVPAGNRK